MFDILVGTLVPASCAVSMIKQLEPKGFECFELNFGGIPSEDIAEYAKKINDARGSAKISAISFYENTMCKPEVYDAVEFLIKNAGLFGCDRVCVFAGADPEKNVPDNMPLFKKTFEPLAKLAEWLCPIASNISAAFFAISITIMLSLTTKGVSNFEYLLPTEAQSPRPNAIVPSSFRLVSMYSR